VVGSNRLSGPQLGVGRPARIDVDLDAVSVRIVKIQRLADPVVDRTETDLAVVEPLRGVA